VIDFILRIDHHLASITAEYGVWTYAILFAIVFAETGLIVAPFLPGDSLLFAAGAICALGTIDIGTLIAVLVLAAVLGDGVNYAIGNLLGHRLFTNPNSKLFRKSYLDRTHAFYEKHGGKTIILARFIPIIRTFAPFVAGVGTMSYRKFAIYNVVGAVLWVTSFTFLGSYFGNQPIVKKNFTLVIGAIIVISALPVIYEVIKNRTALRRNTD
jgi:membrane-associated protein